MKLPLNSEVEYFSNFLELVDVDELFFELNDIIKKTNFNPITEGEITYEVNFKKLCL